MITVIKQPNTNSIVLDSDKTMIHVRTDNEDTLLQLNIGFPEPTILNMPKYNKQAAKFEFQNYFRNKIPSQILVNFLTPSLYQVQNLYDVYSYVVEHKNKTSISNITLNDFRIMYSTKNIEKLSFESFYFLGIPNSMVISSNAVLSIPFFVENKTLQILIHDQNYNKIYSLDTPSLDGYYVIQKFLKLNYDVEFLIVTIKDSTREITKRIRVLKNTLFKPTNIRFRNQFGAIIYCQMFGELSETPSYKNNIYSNQNGLLYNAEVENESQITINTGYLLNDEKFIVEQILLSLDVEIEYEETYIKVVPGTKSIKNFVSNQWIQSNQLTFKFNKYETR